MVQAIANPSETAFLTNAVVERYNFSKLNKTRIRFKIQLKKTTKSNAPKWTDVLKTSDDEQESDLLKVKSSEVGLKGIKVFKALDEAAGQLRQEIASVQEWMTSDSGDWICPIDLAPLVWSELLNIRDNIAPTLRAQLTHEYEKGLTDYQERIDHFLSLTAWELPLDKQEEVKANLLKSFPTLPELEDYLQVVIGRPVIIPALSEQLDQQQAECLQQITQFITQYDQNLEQRLRESAIAANTAKFSGAELETLAAEAALLAFDEDRPQQITLGDLMQCCETITPLAIQDAASVELMQAWSKTARAASSAVAQATTKSLKTARFRNLN